MTLLILILAAISWFMTGLIWFVQIVHYPLYGQVGINDFQEYQKRHINLTGLVVAPPMVAQAFISIWVAVFSNSYDSILLWINCLTVFIIWVITAAVSVPCHNSLLYQGFSEVIHKRLLLANWIRTALWSLCAVIVTKVLFVHI